MQEKFQPVDLARELSAAQPWPRCSGEQRVPWSPQCNGGLLGDAARFRSTEGTGGYRRPGFTGTDRRLRRVCVESAVQTDRGQGSGGGAYRGGTGTSSRMPVCRRFLPVASGHRWCAIARHGAGARSSPKHTTRNVTICSSPKLSLPGPIQRCFPTGAGIFPMPPAARFTTRPAAPSLKPDGRSNALMPDRPSARFSPVRPATRRSCIAPGVDSRRRTG